MKLNEKIKRLRKEKRLSQTELASLTGVHKAHFSRLERGVFRPSVELLKKIAQSLGVSTDYLLNEDVDDFSPVHIEDKNLMEKVKMIDSLDPEEKTAIIKIIDSLLTKKKVVDLVMKETGLAAQLQKS